MIPAPAAGEVIPGEWEDLRAGMLRLPHSAIGMRVGAPALFEVTFSLYDNLRVPDKSCRSAYVISLGNQLQKRLFDR
jgi:hypothetical protein